MSCYIVMASRTANLVSALFDYSASKNLSETVPCMGAVIHSGARPSVVAFTPVGLSGRHVDLHTRFRYDQGIHGDGPVWQDQEGINVDSLNHVSILSGKHGEPRQGVRQGINICRRRAAHAV